MCCKKARPAASGTRAGGGESQETAVMVASWCRSCRRPCSYAQISSKRMTPQKLSCRKSTVRGACLNICAAELKPLAGARQIGATGQAEDLPGKIVAYGERKEILQGGACEPRAHAPHWATKAVCFSSSVTAIIAKPFQPCHRGCRLLHLPHRS